MGGFDVIQRASDNAKYTQFYSKNSSGHITSLAAVTYEDGTRELVADSPLQINDIQIKQVVDGGRRVIVLSGARGKRRVFISFFPGHGGGIYGWPCNTCESRYRRIRRYRRKCSGKWRDGMGREPPAQGQGAVDTVMELGGAGRPTPVGCGEAMTASTCASTTPPISA